VQGPTGIELDADGGCDVVAIERHPFRLITSPDCALMVMAALPLAGAATPASTPFGLVMVTAWLMVNVPKPALSMAVTSPPCATTLNRILKGLARRTERAGIGVAAIRRDEDAIALGQRRRRRQQANNHGGKQRDEGSKLYHDCANPQLMWMCSHIIRTVAFAASTANAECHL